MTGSADIPKLNLLPAARRAPLCVSREDTLRHAETQMLLNDYSQLPVVTGRRTVHGIISWKSIGRAHVVGNAGPKVADCLDSAFRILTSEMPLLDAVDEIISHEIVLVSNPERELVGIVTATDLSLQLRDLTDAFLLVGNIERQIRRLIGDRIGIGVLTSIVRRAPGRIVRGVADLSFGEYVRLLQVPEQWAALQLKVDAAAVLERLEEVRTIRNAVMHFRDGTVDKAALEKLRSTEAFLAALMSVDGH